jgi:flagellin-like hook-associated protein FlgL
MREITVMAQNSTLSSSARGAANEELQALRNEYNRNLSATKFNRQTLLENTSGVLDIQVGNRSSDTLQLRYLRTSGQISGAGTFANAVSSSSNTSSTTRAAFSDFNGDGRTDAAVVDSAGFTRVLLGQADGTFTAIGTIAGSGGAAIAAADFDGDGKADLAIGDGANGLGIYFGQGDGTFQARVSYASAMLELASGDLDNDGDIDLVDRNGARDSQVYINDGTGVFSVGANTNINGFFPVLGPAVGKLNSAGADQIAWVVNSSNLTVRTTTGGPQTPSGGGTLTHFDFFAAETHLVDVNNDGNGDFVFSASNGPDGGIGVNLGNGDGTFAATTSSAVSTYVPRSFAFGDINGDGNLDIVATVVSGGNFLAASYLGNGDGTFSIDTGTLADGGVGAPFRGGVLSDQNGDGISDYVVMETVGNQIYTFLGQASASDSAGLQSLASMPGLSALSQGAAATAAALLDSRESELNDLFGHLGAARSRAEVALRNNESQASEFLTATAKVRDVDVAEELANLTALTARQDVQLALFAQANQEQSLVLKLIAA